MYCRAPWSRTYVVKSLFRTGGRGSQRETPYLCIDLREVVLSKMSLCELARAAPTCREFQQVYLRQAAEERASLIATGKETLGDGAFSGVMTALQRTVCGLETCPGLVGRSFDLATIGSDGVWEMVSMFGAWLRWIEKGTKAQMRRGIDWGEPFDVKILVKDRCGQAPCMSFEVLRGAKGYVQLEVRMKKQAASAGLGLLLAVCTGNPEALLPHLQGSVALTVTIEGDADIPVGREEGKKLAGPLGSLATSFRLCSSPCNGGLTCPKQPCTRGAGHGGVLRRMTLHLP
jgi:hypothetical protein